jgi:glycosyltransferase involved in cell wall biosynthesis
MFSLLSGYDMICIAPSTWAVSWGTQQQMAWRLASQSKVLFVEVPVSPLSPFTGIDINSWYSQIKAWLQGPRALEKATLLIASPPPVLPFRYHGFTNYISQQVLLRYVNRMADKFHFRNKILITFQADSAVLVKSLQARLKIYYCTDDWSASGRWWQPEPLVRKREQELVEACDFVIAVSQRLLHKFEQFGKPVYFLPNAADYDLFSRACLGRVASDIGVLKRPVIGFIGLITPYSFDPNLIIWLAQRHPEWTFVIIGKPVSGEPNLTALNAFSNIHMLGFKPLNVLPQYLAGMDVCLIPWPESDWTKSAFSLKLFEYLAAGKPIVASWTEEYLPYKELVYLASTYEEFERNIKYALSETDRGLVKKRMQLAKNNTWDVRFAYLNNIIKRFLDNDTSTGE